MKYVARKLKFTKFEPEKLYIFFSTLSGVSLCQQLSLAVIEESGAAVQSGTTPWNCLPSKPGQLLETGIFST